MDKQKLLRKLGFSDKHLEHYKIYSKETIEINPELIEDEVFEIETRDTTTMVFNGVSKKSGCNYIVKRQ